MKEIVLGGVVPVLDQVVSAVERWDQGSVYGRAPGALLQQRRPPSSSRSKRKKRY